MIAQVREQFAVHDVLQYEIMRLCNQRKSLNHLCSFTEERIGACRSYVSNKGISINGKITLIRQLLLTIQMSNAIFNGTRRMYNITRPCARIRFNGDSKHTLPRSNKLKNVIACVRRKTAFFSDIGYAFQVWPNVSRRDLCRDIIERDVNVINALELRT